jgi:hypothetical protein
MTLEPQDRNVDIAAAAFARTILYSIRALRHTAWLLAPGDRRVSPEYEISGLIRQSGGSTVIVRPRVDASALELMGQTQEQFVVAVSDISSGEIPELLDYPTLKLYQELGAIAKRGNFINHIRSNGTRADVSSKLKTQLDEELGKDQVVHGSVRGIVKTYSTERRNLIRVVPRAAPGTTCEFNSRLQPKVFAHVEKEAIVTGKLRYRPKDNHPYFMRIVSIDPVERTNPPLTLASLRGMPTQPAQGEPSEDLIRRIRDAW